jgi:hypothetical protein
MDLRLNGLTAVVTGASRGHHILRATADQRYDRASAGYPARQIATAEKGQP